MPHRSARLLLETRTAALRKRLLKEKHWFDDDFRKASRIVKILRRAGLTPFACRRAMIKAFNIVDIQQDAYIIQMGVG